jgi:uncharacterized protein (TIGR02099 family)
MVKSLRFGVVLLSLLFCISYYFINTNETLMPVLSNIDNPPWLEEHLTAYFKEPVHVEEVNFAWEGILKPTLELKNFTISSKMGAVKLHIDRLKLGIDIVASLLNGKITPGDLTLEGSKLFLKEKGQSIIDINGIKSLEADLNSLNSEKFDALINIFLSNGVKQIQGLEINWYDQHDRLMLPVQKINLRMDSHWFVHRFQGTAKTWQGLPFEFTGKIYGTYLAKRHLYPAIHTKLQQVELATNPLLNRFSDRLSVRGGKADLVLDYFGKPDHHLTLTGELATQPLQILDSKTNKFYPVTTIKTQYQLLSQPHGFALQLINLQLAMSGNNLPIHTVEVSKTQNFGIQKINVRMDSFPIKTVTDFLQHYDLLSPKLNEITTQIAPSGSVKHFELKLSSAGTQSAKRMAFSGELQQVTFKPWKHFPGMENLSGVLNFDPYSGSLLLASSQSKLSLPFVFKDPLSLSATSGHIKWSFHKSGWHVHLRDCKVITPEGDAQGSMKITLPQNGTSPVIESKARFNINSLANVAQYYPVRAMPKSVWSWLEKSIKGGQLQKGSFILNGKLKDFPFDNNQGKFEISANLKDGLLHYKNNWPDVEHLDAHLLFAGRSMQILSKSAKILGTEVTQATAEIPNLEKTLLLINGQLRSVKNQDIFVTKDINPLAQKVSWSPLHNLEIKGPWNLNLKLALPLHSDLKQNVNYSGKINFDHATINSQTSALALRNLVGEFNFAQDRMNTKRLTGELFSQPFTMTMNTKEMGGAVISEMNLTSVISIKDLQKLVTFDLLDNLAGTSTFGTHFTFNHTAMANHYDLQITSNLLGINSNLPAPFNKSTNDAWLSYFILKGEGNKTITNFKVGQTLNGFLNFAMQDNQLKFDNGTVHFGPQKIVQNDVLSFQRNLQSRSIHNKGLTVDGTISELNWSAWKKVFSRTQTDVNHEKKNWSSTVSIINKIDLNLDHFHFLDNDFPMLRLQAYQSKNDFAIALAGENIKGNVTIPANYPKAPLIANFDHLTLASNDSHALLKPNDIPPLELSIGRLNYHDKLIQNISLKLQPLGNDVIIKQVQIEEPGLKILASGRWHSGNNAQETILNGDLSSNNLGAFLNQWHITDNVVKGMGTAHFNLSWPNSPMNGEKKTLQGNLDLNFKQGRIINLGSQVDVGMGIGRLLNLLSLQTLPRRLKGDFSDLTGSGYSFDELTGLLQLKQGNIFTENASLDGTVGKVKIKGRIGLVKKDYDLRLIINPNVTSSLPIVATLTAGPLVGLATWVADKVFSRQVKKMTEIHYNVTGSWENPDMHNLSQE